VPDLASRANVITRTVSISSEPPTTPTMPSVSPTATPTASPTPSPTVPVPDGPTPEPIGRSFANPVEAVYGLGDSTALAFAPDGETIVTGSTDTTVRLWDTASGDMLRRFVGHPWAVYAVAVAPDGSRIVAGSYPSALFEINPLAVMTQFRPFPLAW
jgi:WD40 repeat protein